SERTSTKTGIAPRKTKAFPVLENVHDGMMTSSPGPISARIAAISRAPVQECVSSARPRPSCPSRKLWQRAVNSPLPEMCEFSIAFVMYSISRPTSVGILNGSFVIDGPRLLARLFTTMPVPVSRFAILISAAEGLDGASRSLAASARAVGYEFSCVACYVLDKDPSQFNSSQFEA